MMSGIKEPRTDKSFDLAMDILHGTFNPFLDLYFLVTEWWLQFYHFLDYNYIKHNSFMPLSNRTFHHYSFTLPSLLNEASVNNKFGLHQPR